MSAIAIILFFIFIPALVILWGGALLWELQQRHDVTSDECRYCNRPGAQSGENGFCPECVEVFRKQRIFWSMGKGERGKRGRGEEVEAA